MIITDIFSAGGSFLLDFQFIKKLSNKYVTLYWDNLLLINIFQ